MTKLNLGYGDKKLEGFDNLDKIDGWTFQQGLPQYDNSSVDAITISHALMFLTSKELLTFLNEAHRVLRASGIIRITEDDTENPQSDTYKTGNLKSGPKCLTGPNMMRSLLEIAGFRVHDVDEKTTHYSDESLLQNYHKGRPRCFFVEAVKEFEIKISSRNELPQFFIDMGYKVGAEIGVCKGEFSEKIARVGLKLYAIDPWKVYKEYIEPGGQARFDFLYEHTQRTLKPYPNCTIVRKTSMEAVGDFADESLDFVYIDGNHDFRYIAEDLAEWSKKVRKGGIVSGHDYQIVGSVLNAYLESYKIPNCYLLTKDKWPSWMFFKN